MVLAAVAREGMAAATAATRGKIPENFMMTERVMVDLLKGGGE